jgi:hypothetical protein
MSAKTLCSEQEIYLPSQHAVVRSNRRRNAVFMGMGEHLQLMKMIEEEDCEMFALATAHSLSS